MSKIFKLRNKNNIITWCSSSSFATARRMCLGVTRPFLLSRAAFPANSKISADLEKQIKIMYHTTGLQIQRMGVIHKVHHYILQF